MFRKLAIVTLFLLAFQSVHAKSTIIKGQVIDAASREPLSFVAIYVPLTSYGTTTDENGRFRFEVAEQVSHVEASFIGYTTARRSVLPGQVNDLLIVLEVDAGHLDEVVIKSKRLKYSNKDNPAVELVRKVIAHKHQNRPDAYNYISFQEYENIQLALSNTPEKLRKNLLLRKYPFLLSGIDTTKLEGKATLPLYLDESVSENYLSFRPGRRKKIITAEKKVAFDNNFIDGEGVRNYLKHIYQPVDIYENNINVVTNQFLSPLADLSPSLYQFFLGDTVVKNGTKLVNLIFGPRNAADFLFMGNMFITLDGRYAVESVRLRLNKHINLNWVKDLQIAQDFEPDDKGKFHLSKSRLAIEFGITGSSDGGMYGERSVFYNNYVTDQIISDTVFSGPEIESRVAAATNDQALSVSRNENGSNSEQVVYENMERLQNTKSFRNTLNVLSIVVAGYTKVSDHFEIGPVNTFYSYNPVEGFRLRAGGRTTPEFNKHLYFETYAAYGFRDEKWKYFLGATYSFTGKNRFEFPARNLTISYQKDTKIPGQELEFIQEDNILLSLKRGVNDKWLYNKVFNVEYLREFSNNLSYKLAFKNWEQQAAGSLEYFKEGTLEPVKSITTSEFAVELRWAPNEKFYQGKSYRIPFPNRYPIFTFRASAGIKGFLDGGFNYQRLNLNVFKRVYLSQLGFADVSVEGGYIFGSLPYPLLAIPRANQTYSYQLRSYNLMNFLEFVADRYAGVQLEHNFNGFILNKIPLVKKLKLREIITAKVLYGGLRKENIPGNDNPGLLSFPAGANGDATTFSLQREPYIEGSVGLGNILRFFRIDLVKRFTYLDHPHVASLGIRGRFRFDF